MSNTFKARLGKPEPVWQDEILPDGKKIKVRYLKLSYYCTILDFPDALQFDGADMYISKQDPELTSADMVTIPKTEYEALTSGKNWLMPEASRQKILLAIDALKDSLTEESAAEERG